MNLHPPRTGSLPAEGSHGISKQKRGQKSSQNAGQIEKSSGASKPRVKEYAEPRVSDEGVLFRRFLKNLRKRCGLTQQELAQRLGMSQALISRGEQGNRKVDVLELRHFCRALGLDFIQTLADLDALLRKIEAPDIYVQPDPEHDRPKGRKYN